MLVVVGLFLDTNKQSKVRLRTQIKKEKTKYNFGFILKIEGEENNKEKIKWNEIVR